MLWRHRAEILLQSRIIYWQRRSLNYTSAKGAPVYVHGKIVLNWVDVREFRSAGSSAPPPNGDVPNCWTQLDSLAGPFLTPSRTTLNRTPDAVVFLHERRSPSGKRFLICVGIYADWKPPPVGGRGFVTADALASVAIEPASWTGKPSTKVRPNERSILRLIGSPNLVHKRVWAGQLDPDDASRFTIKYELNAVTDIIDGAVDDLGNVTLTPRKPPWNADSAGPLIF